MSMARLWIPLLIVCGNASVALGIFLWGWSVYEVLYFYWAENLLIGLFTIIRLIRKSILFHVSAFVSGVLFASFFLLHYGIFIAGHGIIMTDVFAPNVIDIDEVISNPFILFYIPSLIGMTGFGIAFLGVFMAQAVQFIEHLHMDARASHSLRFIMMAPYERILAIHVTILFGAGLFMAFNAPAFALIFFLVFKTMCDLGFIFFGRYKSRKV